MDQKTFDKKWGGKTRGELNDKQYRQFIEDCFALYEGKGYAERFHTPYDQYQSRIGMKFTVLRRALKREVDNEALPMWNIRFEDGTTAFAYPEEIIHGEQLWTFQQRLQVLVSDALAAVDSFEKGVVPVRSIILPTREQAINCDDAWLIIGDGEPRLRDKRDQRILEKDPGYRGNFTETPLSSWPPADIVALADEILHGAPRGQKPRWIAANVQ